MTQTPTDHNQALRDALEKLEQVALDAVSHVRQTNYAARESEAMHWIRMAADKARDALAMQEPASEPAPASAPSCCGEEAAKIADERGYELRAYAHRASDKVSLGQDAVAMAECFRVGQLIRSMAKAVCARCKIGTSHE